MVEGELQGLTGGFQRLVKEEHRLVIGVHLGFRAAADIDGPAGLGVLVDGAHHRETRLLVVGERRGEGLLLSADREVELRQHEIAIARPAGTGLGERVVGERT